VLQCAILELLDLESKEEGQLTHHRHLESLCHNPTKLLAQRLVSRTKYNVINIYLAQKISLSTLRVKRVGSALPISKPFHKRKSLRHSYIALRACLSP
jgi:hypothetical protein